ncbi:MAG: flippase-like domain-containing protein [Candidatus Omnitrophica bacterium]|nr:flippase-like domain-containing protein [Candidatus Omnitrophota bacterium]
MRKNILFTFLKFFVSFLFIYLILRKINFDEVGQVLKNVDLFSLSITFLFIFFINIPLALRFKYILEIYFKETLSLLLIWKLTMIGLFFNNFLPTSAGGDIVKIFYIVKDEKEKLLSGISILIDRYIGALTVMTMGTISVLFYYYEKISILILILMFLLIFFFYFFSKREIAFFFYKFLKKIFPPIINEKLLVFYNSINFYFVENKRKLYLAILISFITQILSIFSQYFLVYSILKKKISFYPFFIFIPLIWTSTLIPSIGGLGIREFSYIYLFSNFIGKDNAYALSLLVLLSIIFNSIIGGVIFLTFRVKKFH